MNAVVHRVYILSMVLVVFATLLILILNGYQYYITSLEERFYHHDHSFLKPSGLAGHGLGIVGSLFMIIGVGSYMARKRIKVMSRLGLIKHWLEFHIFLCVLGPIMVLFHTAFKFGGIVSVSFWSMVAVFASGIIGRFIYLQIPRTVEGRELSLKEVKSLKDGISDTIQNSFDLDNSQHNKLKTISEDQAKGYSRNLVAGYLQKVLNQRIYLKKVKAVVKNFDLSNIRQKELIKLVRKEISITNRMDRLLYMQKLFRYWHVVHLPFALVMLVIMIIHIAVTLAFGYKWIF